MNILFNITRTLFLDMAIEALFDKVFVNWFTSFRGTGETLTISEALKIKYFQYVRLELENPIILQGVKATNINIFEATEILIKRYNRNVSKEDMSQIYGKINFDTVFLLLEGRPIGNSKTIPYIPIPIRDFNRTLGITFYR